MKVLTVKKKFIKQICFCSNIGIDYFVHLDNGWKIGAVLDLELDNYLVKFNRNELNREKALVTGILVGYEFDKYWSFSLGFGIEFEKNKSLKGTSFLCYDDWCSG
jgi:hypothetical protein